MRKGDFILENSQVRFVIREPSSSLTDPIAVGGSLIYGGKGEDLIFELRPERLQSRSLTPVIQNQEDETSLSLTLNTVLDAVKTNVPMRRLSTQLVGDLPTTTNVRLQ